MSITLHGFQLSGHSHRVQLALSLMGLAHQVVQVDLKNGAHEVIDRAHGLIKVMNAQLATRLFLVGHSATVADIASYSNLSAAPEGNVDLATYPNVRAWLARVEALPGFVPFQKTPVGLGLIVTCRATPGADHAHPHRTPRQPFS